MRVATCGLLAAGFVLAALPRPVAGQDSTFAALKCHADRGGAIRGVLVDSVSGAPIPERTVFLSFDCIARTDSLGRFEIARIPPGQYLLQVATWGFRRFRPRPVAIAADSVLDLRVQWRTENAVLDCQDKPACAATLRPDSAGVAGLTSVQRLTYAAWRTAFALAGWTADPAVAWIPCGEESDAAVRRALERRFGPLVAPARCLDPTMQSRRSKLFRLTSGQPARLLRIERVWLTSADEAVGDVSYLAGPLWGTVWECRFRRRGTDWTPEWCRIKGMY